MRVQLCVLFLAPVIVCVPKVRAQVVLKSEAKLSPAVTRYVKVPAGKILLKDVRVIDGTGAAPMEHQMVMIVGGRLRALRRMWRTRRCQTIRR
jgi:hypothetical protein